jgi:NAD(P)H-flavin reductase
MASVVPELLPAPGPMAPRAFRVTDRVGETGDTWTLTLQPVEGSEITVDPGQFVMVYAFGIGEVPISVSGATGRPGPLVLTVRVVGAVTEAICRCTAGAVLGVRGPLGNAWPITEAVGGDVLVVAGGIGLAPLRPVVVHALDHRAEYDRVVLLYGARTPADLLYRSELDAWDAEVTVDAADQGWKGKVGVVPKLVPDARVEPERATAFVVGPEVMMRYTIQALIDRGLDPRRIHVSLERNMRCGLGHCGHCQLGPTLICRDGPVYSYEQAAPWLEVREL